ncbi:thiol:disulfide interchange protein [Granulicella aggregans]|uniref:Thiol:disulfide interchange protein n=1 Tax=Granulicella aggregans TaxID=474949 RepID=A0A7W7ZB62_9BACT|nr:thiol:disulfide interchange protein [Granulicella aggregans]
MKLSNVFRNLALFSVAVLTLSLASPQIQAQVPFVKKHIYSETADPKADIATALAQAKKEHKRVLLDFGGDWCGDCQVLDIYFHQAPNEALLEKNFVLVHVWIGHIDKNLDIPEKYGVAIKKGVPALAVVSAKGDPIFAQKTGEFENMRNMNPESVTSFLEKWKQ